MTNKNDRYMGQAPMYCQKHKNYFFIICIGCSLEGAEKKDV
jgi:hypothetical protein